LVHEGTEHRPIQVWTGDYLYVQFGDMKSRPPFSNECKRLKLLRRLNELPSVTLPNNAIDKYPSIPLTTLNNEAALKQFLDTLDWVVQKIRRSE
jgi:hypothetical protein